MPQGLCHEFWRTLLPWRMLARNNRYVFREPLALGGYLRLLLRAVKSIKKPCIARNAGLFVRKPEESILLRKRLRRVAGEQNVSRRGRHPELCLLLQEDPGWIWNRHGCMPG